MNIQQVFDALEQDGHNSALGIIVAALERQGYGVQINQKIVDATGFFEGNYHDLENEMGYLDFALFRGNILEQEFSIKFIDFHDFIVRRKADVSVRQSGSQI